MVLQVPSFNYLPIKAQKCSLFPTLLFHDLPFHEGEKGNKRLTGRNILSFVFNLGFSCVPLIALQAGNSYSLLNYKGHIIPASFCRRIMVWGRKRKGHYFSRLLSQRGASAKGLCVLLGTESFISNMQSG